MIIPAIVSFLGASLLFLIQLIVGKQILPWFGGVASVWTTLMLFFTTTLFLAYVFVYFLSKYKLKTQVKIYSSVLIFTLLPHVISLIKFQTILFPNRVLMESLSLPPQLAILTINFATVGLPFFLLSTTCVILQSWLSIIEPKKSPYSLYALSNAGSLVGLLSYPLFIEPKLDILSQEKLWSILFLIFIGLLSYILFYVYHSKFPFKSQITHNNVSKINFIHWLFLATASNIALLAFTSHLSQIISPIPFLWMLPLAVYLLSFVLAFSNSNFYSRKFHGGLLISSLLITALQNIDIITFPDYLYLLALNLVTLFLINYICHAELYRSRPSNTQNTKFYLSISAGGVIASLFCSIIAPSFFSGFLEYQISLILIILVFFYTSLSKPINTLKIIQYLILSLFCLFLISKQFYTDKMVFKSRNFYGLTQIQEFQRDKTATISAQNPLVRYLVSGNTSHGAQTFTGGNDFDLTLYYKRNTGAGIFIDQNIKRIQGKPLQIGVIGLGVGTMAGYCRKDDYFRFYEINPAIIDISEKKFTFLKHCRDIGGKVDIIKGDARIELEKESVQDPQKLDFIVVDAFTDDAIPVHLLTSEAIRIYLSRLAPGGAIGFHISNRYLALNKSLESTIASLNLYRSWYITDDAEWYLVSSEPLKNSRPTFTQVRKNQNNKIKPWTDNYTNLFQTLKPLEK